MNVGAEKPIFNTAVRIPEDSNRESWGKVMKPLFSARSMAENPSIYEENVKPGKQSFSSAKLLPPDSYRANNKES